MSAIFLGLLSALPLSAPELRSYPFELPAHVDKVLCEDANGDGRLDLVYAAGSRIGVYLQKGDGSFDCEGAGATLSLATFAQRAVAWCPTKNATGPWGIAALSGSSLRFFPFDAVKRKFSQGQVWLEKVSATLPSGVHYMSLAKDVNRDG
ncbi:MAG: VCBS repeat-containing protein, partial [Planctomycetota bacterium]